VGGQSKKDGAFCTLVRYKKFNKNVVNELNGTGHWKPEPEWNDNNFDQWEAPLNWFKNSPASK
jgi:hypothetical protein